MEKHLKTGLVVTNVCGLVVVMEYLQWLRYFDWLQKAENSIYKILKQ